MIKDYKTIFYSKHKKLIAENIGERVVNNSYDDQRHNRNHKQGGNVGQNQVVSDEHHAKTLEYFSTNVLDIALQ